MALAYRSAGPAGLALLKAVLVAGVFVLVWTSVRGAHRGVVVAAMAWVVFGAAHMTSTIRPQLWSFVFMALLVRALTERQDRRPLWLAPMFAAWANLHGGWFVGIGVLAAWELSESWSAGRLRSRTPLLFAACLAATLCTPYGWRLWEFIWQTVRPERAITEWRPLWESGSGLEWSAWLGTTAAVLWAARRSAPNRLARVVVLGILAFAAVRVMRMGSLYVVSAAILLPPFLPSAIRVRPARAASPHSRWAPLVLALPLLLSLVAAARIGSFSLSCLPSSLGPWAADAAVKDVLAGAPPGRLVTSFDWGQYAIWHLGPRIRVSVDGRRETVYSQAHLLRHDEVVRGTPEGVATLAGWAPDYVWLPQSRSETKQWLLNNGYQTAIETERSYLMARRPLSLAVAAPGRVSTVTAARCFPD
jgi:hypothetical protein